MGNLFYFHKIKKYLSFKFTQSTILLMVYILHIIPSNQLFAHDTTVNSSTSSYYIYIICAIIEVRYFIRDIVFTVYEKNINVN